LILLAGSSDGYLSLHEYKNEVWNYFQFFGHGFGVNSVSWAPLNTQTGSNENIIGSNFNDSRPLRFASGGMDNLIRIWHSRDNNIKSFYVTSTLEGHEDFVRDVAWRPNSNNTSNIAVFDTIASCGDVKD
jgi:protein transport protein SEC13